MKDLQFNQVIPPIIGCKSKKGTPRGGAMQDESKKQQQLEWKEVTWEFDIKD